MLLQPVGSFQPLHTSPLVLSTQLPSVSIVIQRRYLLLTVAVIMITASSGCLTLNPSVNFDTAGSTVFETASVSGALATGQVATTVTLSSNATTSHGVTQLNVITSDGKSFYKTTLDSGESTTTVMLPTNGTATVVAVNTINATTVESRNVTITGDQMV